MIARNKSIETVWVVVVVKGGFPVSVEVHRDRKIAKQRERFLSKDLREAYDEIGLFKIEIGAQAPD
ncbi:hypothetical protein TFLX_01085 [Thermoflexales bacterium]|nr:hypothetical protein TFLX_01085 [Thermoflexales bacterium]